MKSYKDIFLDLDETVLDFKKGQKNALFAACKEFGLTITDEDCGQYDKINKEAWKTYERGEVEKPVMLVKRYENYLRYLGKEGDPAVLNALYGKYLSMQGCFLPGAEEGVRYLKSKYRLSLITNGNVATQQGRLKAAGLNNFFDHVFISDEVGFRKPDVEFFEYALRVSGAEKESTLVIGDSPSSDILGAKNSGLDAVLFDYRNNTNCPHPYLKKFHDWTDLCAYL